jgi:hypothetical protein
MEGVRSLPVLSTPVHCVKPCSLKDLTDRQDNSDLIVPMSIVVVRGTGLAMTPVAMTLLGVPCAPPVATPGAASQTLSRGVTRPSRMESRGLKKGMLLRTVAGEAMSMPVPTITDARVSGGVIRRGLKCRTSSRGVMRSKLLPRPL